MSGIKGKNLGTAYHIYDLQAERQTSEYDPKTIICTYTKFLDGRCVKGARANREEENRLRREEKKKLRKTSKKRKKVKDIPSDEYGYNQKWRRWKKKALYAGLTADDVRKFFETKDYDGLKDAVNQKLEMGGLNFSIFEHQPGWNKRWMRFAKTALTLRISTEEFKKYFVNNDYDGFREVLRREAKASATWHMRGWNQQWTNLKKKAQKLGVNEELLNDYFEVDDREGFKEILRQKRNDSNQ